MSITLQFVGELATVEGSVWTCSNAPIERLFTNVTRLREKQGHSIDEHSLATHMTATYGATIVGGDSFVARVESMGVDDESEWTNATRELLLSRAKGAAKPHKVPLTGGQWKTINGAHVYIKGGKIVAGHLHGAATIAGLSEEGHKTLQDAHSAGQLPTDSHLYGALEHATKEIKSGKSEKEALHEGITKHGEAPTTPVKSGETKTHALPIVTDKTKHVYGDLVKVVTHGHSVDEGDVAAMAQLAEVSPKATAALLDAHAQGKIKDDHHLASLIKDMHDVHAATHYFTPTKALEHLLDGKTAEEATAHGKALKKESGKASAAAKKAAEQNNLVSPAVPTPVAPAPAVAPPEPVTSVSPVNAASGHSDLAQYALGKGLSGVSVTMPDHWAKQSAAGKITDANAQDILDQAVALAQLDGKKELNSIHLDVAIQSVNQSAGGAPNVTPDPVTSGLNPSPVATPAPPSHHVTFNDASGKPLQMHVDHAKPVSIGDVDSLATDGVKISDKGKIALKTAIGAADIQTHGHLMEAAALAQASSKHFGASSITGAGVDDMMKKYGGKIEALLDAAHGGDSDAQGIQNHLGTHSFESPTAKAHDAAVQKHQMELFSFHTASPSDHLHKQVGAQKGSNTGGLYEMPDGQQNYVKFHANGATNPHSEHAANGIYKALGFSAPESSVFDHDGKTVYASKIIPNQGTLGKVGLTPEHAKEMLKGFAADALLGNWDVLGASNDNVVIGHDGKLHRIDNGGAGLFKATGGLKPDKHIHRLLEWKGLADPAINPNYAKVFQTAGVKSADEIPGIGAQVKAITTLRDAHGGWENFLTQTAPGMNAADRTKTAAMLETRTQLLQDKVKSTPMANSVAESRTFTYKHNKGHYGPSEHLLHLEALHEKNAPPLSTEEKSAVSAFKGSAYSHWNQALLGKHALTPTEAKHTATLDAMFQKPEYVLGEDSALSRKITLDDNAKKALAGLQPGDLIAHTPVYQSTATSSSTWSGNVHLCILAPKEMPAIPMKAGTGYTDSGGEKEVFMPRGVSYRVVSSSGPTDPPPANTPADWEWHSGAHRMVVEAIVPGVNDAEVPVPNIHQINADQIQKNINDLKAQGKKVAPIAPNLSGLPQHVIESLPSGNMSDPNAVPVKKSKKKAP